MVAAEQAAELTLAQEREPELTVPAAPEADLFADAGSAHDLDEALAPHDERLGGQDDSLPPPAYQGQPDAPLQLGEDTPVCQPMKRWRAFGLR